MEYKDLIDQLRRMAVETGGIICLGCGCQVLVGNRLPPFAPNRADGDECDG